MGLSAFFFSKAVWGIPLQPMRLWGYIKGCSEQFLIAFTLPRFCAIRNAALQIFSSARESAPVYPLSPRMHVYLPGRSACVTVTSLTPIIVGSEAYQVLFQSHEQNRVESQRTEIRAVAAY